MGVGPTDHELGRGPKSSRKPQSPWRSGWRAASDSKAPSTMAVKMPKEPASLRIGKPGGPFPWGRLSSGNVLELWPQKPLHSPLWSCLSGRFLSHWAGKLAVSLQAFWGNLAGRKVSKPAQEERPHQNLEERGRLSENYLKGPCFHMMLYIWKNQHILR